MILRWIGYGLLFVLMIILSIPIVPLIYPFRKFIRKHKENFFWYFLNDTTKGRDAGDYGRFSHNFIGYIKQCLFRNPHWNLKLKLSPKTGVKENLKGKTYLYNVNKPLVTGFNWCTYFIEGIKYFRMSFTLKIFWLFYISSQLGAADNRYLYKFKIGLQ